LVECIVSNKLGSDVVDDIADGLGYTLAEIATLYIVTEFHSLMLSGGGSTWDGRASDGSAGQMDVGFECGIAAGIKDLTGVDCCDGRVVHVLGNG
jgi:hypothetical protein